MPFFQFEDCSKAIKTKITERNLKILVILLLVLLLSVFVALLIVSNQAHEIAYELKEEKQRICFTPGCIKKASNVLANMDPSMDPCDDFYQFACGGFLNKTNIPDDQSQVTSFTSIKNLVYQQIRNILEEPQQIDEIKPFILTKQLYSHCINTSAIESDGLTTIKAVLDTLGGWPLLEGENWYDGKFDWKQTMYTLRNIGYGANYFVSVKVITDLKESSRRVIGLSEAKLELQREVLLEGLDHALVQLYYEYMIDVAVLFGANHSEASEDLKQSLDLEIAIANISLPREQGRNESALYNPMTMVELQRRYPNTNWKEYMKYLLDIPDFKITNDETVIVQVPQYLDDLEDLLNRTSKRDQANYIMWRVVSSSMGYLAEELRNRKRKFSQALTGAYKPLPRWKQCIFQTLYRLWKPLRTYYDRKHFSKNAKKIVTEMVSRIETEFTNILRNAEWMDEDSKESALKKADSKSIYIGSLEQDDENLTEYYSALSLNSDNYFKMILSVSLFNNNNYYKNLRKPVPKKSKERDISMEYSIYVPGGIFQEVFFDNDQPHYMNYGGIGVLMGHLISHNFDNKGRQFDTQGDLVNWWTQNTEEAFNEHSQCISHQYGNYSIPEISLYLDGNSTRDENIADAGGIKAAYLAYNSWIEENSSEPQLPGLNYTSQQMFWISVANTFAPEYYRVIGSLSNSEYFAKDFNCPLGARMNPEEKCKIW